MNARPEVRFVQPNVGQDLTFSVCSLVRDEDRYNALLETFRSFGFTEANTEFLAADNRDENRFDGYSWQTRLLQECRGRYVIYCHEDLTLVDEGYDALVQRLDELTALDPAWLLAGVAGGAWRSGQAEERRLNMRISDKFGADQRVGTLPGRVESLDECFMIMKREQPVVNSYDLSGFHYYGADLCLQSELLGGRAYAIDFHLHHHGEGAKGKSFRQARNAFRTKYEKIFPGRALHCTTGVVQFGEARWAELT